MSRTIKILISNWPQERKFSQLLQTGKAVVFYFFSPWSRIGHALRLIFLLWLVKIWKVFFFGEKILLIAEADRVLRHLVMLLTVFFH